MKVRPAISIAAGALVIAIIAVIVGAAGDRKFTARIASSADAAIAQAGGAGVTARFENNSGWPTRHPVLSGGEALNEDTRQRVASQVAAIPGVGGVHWADGTMIAESGEQLAIPTNCQDDVEALLNARTIRFEESSTEIESGSRELIDEVATALRPCLGSIIAIIGHTDSSGPEAGNIAISKDRAASVREALIRSGIPRDGLRARGVGSREPVEGLDPSDPANRRIEFSVVSTVPLVPTPVDTPSAR